ncbi:hypothetical protein [Roseovarius sp.]|uniref:hypothetical protein n=1 Tax=Roseovarius sp. TaxID=1486281 RepID=UPI0035665509
MLKTDLVKLRALLHSSVNGGQSRNAIADAISKKVRELIEAADPEWFKKMRHSVTEKNAIARSKIVKLMASNAAQDTMDFRVLYAIFLLYDQDVSADGVFRPLLRREHLDYHVSFTAKNLSNNPHATQYYELSPSPVSILKSPLTVTYHDDESGKKKRLEHLLVTPDARITARAVQGQPTSKVPVPSDWLIINDANMTHPLLLIAADRPLVEHDLFSLAVSPAGNRTVIHATIQDLPFQTELRPWINMNVSEDTTIAWTLLAPASTVRLLPNEPSENEPSEDEVARVKGIVQRALIREFFTETSPYPNHFPLALSKTVLSGPIPEEKDDPQDPTSADDSTRTEGKQGG